MTNNSNTRADYIYRINKVMDFIESNLTNEISLNELASVASFSPFHFHRIFKAMVGETIREYILRLRIEKSANQLTANHKKSITEIALDCGFSSSAHFARVFKDTYGVSASEWRNGEACKYSKQNSNTDQMSSNIIKAKSEIKTHLDSETNKLMWRIKMSNESKLTADVKVKDIEDIHVVYVRNTGPYAGDQALFESLFMKLIKWMQPRDLLIPGKTKAYTIYHDDPKITDEDKLRISVCFSVPEYTQAEGEIGKMVIKGGKYAVANFTINADQYEEAWTSVYSEWLPQSGYQPDDRPCFENNVNNPQEHPEGKHIVDIYVPVRPL